MEKSGLIKRILRPVQRYSEYNKCEFDLIKPGRIQLATGNRAGLFSFGQ